MAVATDEPRLSGWDPVYGNDTSSKENDEFWDAATLGLAGNGARHARSQAVGTLQNLQGPEYDPTGFQYQGDFNPEALADPEAAKAQMVQESPEGRAAQLAALQQLSQEQDQSIGSQSALGRYQAEQDASQFSNSREQAIKQDAMRRGRVGGAADMIARQQSAQAGANQNLNAGLQNAQMAALLQLAGTQAQGGLAGQLRGQDQATAFSNQDAINKFNLSNTAARNAVNQHNVGNRNEAAQLNRQGRQAISSANTTRGDDIVNNKYAARSGKANSIANALGGFATGQQQQSGQQQSAAAGLIKTLFSAYGAGAGGGKAPTAAAAAAPAAAAAEEWV